MVPCGPPKTLPAGFWPVLAEGSTSGQQHSRQGDGCYGSAFHFLDPPSSYWFIFHS